MDDWVCIQCLVTIPSAHTHCPHCGGPRSEVSHRGGKASDGDLPRVYIVTYQGSSRDDAEHQAELDERRHALAGYVATSRRWTETGWTAGNLARTLSGLFVWRGVWGQRGDRAMKSTLFGPPAVLEVTFSLEDQAPDE